jgi:hypothetical protein
MQFINDNCIIKTDKLQWTIMYKIVAWPNKEGISNNNELWNCMNISDIPYTTQTQISFGKAWPNKEDILNFDKSWKQFR